MPSNLPANSREQTGSRSASDLAAASREAPGRGLFPAMRLDDVVLPTDVAQWLDWGIVAAVMLASAVALSLNAADPDLWGHVQYGRDALQNGLSATTTYSYVAEGYPWINHEILAEYVLAIVNDVLEEVDVRACWQ